MSASRRRFTQELKHELCREVISTSKPIKDVAVTYAVGPETLRNCLIKYREANGGTETELTVSECVRRKELERKNAGVGGRDGIPERATAYFARQQR